MADNLPKIIADFQTSLSGSVSAGDTTATLQNAVDSDGVALPNGLYAFTTDKDSSSLKEFFIGTLTGSDITDIKSVSRQGVSTTGFARGHRSGANVIISNHSSLAVLTKQVGGESGLDADSPIFYDAEPTLSQREEVATKGYVDDSGSTGAISYAKVIVTGNAGETLTAGEVVYFKTSDQEWYKADADTAYGENTQFGIAQGAGTDGASITGGVLIRGTDVNQTGMTAGASQYISTTAGELTETAPTNDIFVGVAKSATSVIVNFENRITDYLDSDAVTQSTTLGEQTTSTNTVETGEADATTKKNSIAQSFVATKTKMRGVNLWKKADTGTFTGSVVITLQADSSGEPSGTALATATLTNSQWIVLTDDAQFEALFASEYDSLTVGDTYWIDIQPSTSDNSNHPNVGADTSGGSGGAYYNNTTDGWVQIASSDLYYQILEGNVNQITKTDSTGKLSIDLIDVANILIPGVDTTYNLEWIKYALPLVDDDSDRRFWQSFSGVLGSVISIDGTVAVSNLLEGARWTNPLEMSFFADISTGDETMLGYSELTTLIVNHLLVTRHCAFVLDSSGTLYASVADGTTQTLEEITGVTVTDKHHYAVKLDGGTSAEFWIDGVLRKTLTTNLPSAGTPRAHFSKGSGGVQTYVWNPIVAFKLI